MNTDKKELTSAFTHLGGAVFGLIGIFLFLIGDKISNAVTQQHF